MSASSSRFTIIFKAVGTNSLKNVRSVLRGVEQQSYTSLNAFNRNMSSMEKKTINSLNNIDRRLSGFGKSLRLFSMAGMGLTAVSAGFGALVSGIALANRAFISTNSQMQTSKILIEELLGNKGSAKEFVSVMQNLSASFGVDIAETMNSSRGMLQVMKQVGKGNVQPKDLERMLKMTMAIGAMDIENRGLSYTAFSIKEAFQGLGQGDFRSLRNRLEINLGRPVEQAITKALKAGDLNKAIDIFDEGLKRIGINSDKLLKRLNKEGFVQNLSRLQSYITRSFQMVGEKMYYSLTTPFYKLNEFLERQFKEGGRGGAILTGLGESLYRGFQPALDKIKQVGIEMYNNRTIIADSLSDMIYSSAKLGKSFGTMFLSFFKGLFGIKTNTKSQVQDMVTMMKTMKIFADKLSLTFDKLSPILKNVGESVHNIISEVGKMAVNTGLMSAGGGLAGVAGGIATIIGNGIAGILNTINSIIGNKAPYDPTNPNTPNTSNMLQNGTNLVLMGSILFPLLTKIKKGGATGTTGATGNLATTEANVVNSTSKISNNKLTNAQFMGEVAGNNRLRIAELDKKISQIPNNIANSNIKNSVEYLKAEKFMLSKSESDLINLSKKHKNDVASGLVSKEVLANQEKKISREMEQLYLDKQKIGLIERDIKLGNEYNSMIKERADLIKTDKYLEKRIKNTLKDPKTPTMWEKVKSKVGSLESLYMMTMIGAGGLQIISSIKSFVTGAGGLKGIGMAVANVSTKFGLLGIAIGGTILALGGIYAWYKNLDKKDEQDEQNRVNQHNSDMEVVKAKKRSEFNAFMQKHGFSADSIKNLYDKGAGGHAPNPSQLAMFYAGKTGSTVKWGKSLEEENNARRIMQEAFKNGTITVEGAKDALGMNAINALTDPETIKATMEANIQLTGMSKDMQMKFETIMSNTMIKALKGGDAGIQGIPDDPKLRLENDLKTVGQYGDITQ